MTLSSSYSRN